MPRPEELFATHFLPLYPDLDEASGPTGPLALPEALARARSTDVNPANNASILAHIDDAARVFVGMAPAIFDEDLGLDRSDASVHRLSRALTIARRDAWTAVGAGTADGPLFNVVVHGAAYVGSCVVAAHGGAWSARRPLWESVVRLRSRAGEGDLPVFHWWLKSLGDDALLGRAATLADRYRSHVEVPCLRPEEIPVLAPPDRPLPRLSRVRYDVFYKYLRAHLPELRDVGADFPSPERFQELGLRWLDFKMVGGGRALLVYGPGSGGTHLFWLGGAGFEKAAFYPSDAFPDPVVRDRGETLEVVVQVAGGLRVHEMLWWGP